MKDSLFFILNDPIYRLKEAPKFIVNWLCNVSAAVKFPVLYFANGTFNSV